MNTSLNLRTIENLDLENVNNVKNSIERVISRKQSERSGKETFEIKDEDSE